MLNNIVDNYEQRGQHNIEQCCFQQPLTGCAFFAAYEDEPTVQVHFVKPRNFDKRVQVYLQTNGNQRQYNKDDFNLKMTRNLLTIGCREL